MKYTYLIKTKVAFLPVFYCVHTVLCYISSHLVAGAVQQAEGIPGGRAGLQEAGLGSGLYGMEPGALCPCLSPYTEAGLSNRQNAPSYTNHYITQGCIGGIVFHDKVIPECTGATLSFQHDT